MTQIINITDYSNTLTNYTLVDGLTPDIIKIKYIWLLNALVENAIIGQDEYGLVWYDGTWYSGEWEDGTWYSGIWHDGEWKNGKFYSIRFDKRQLLLRNKRIIEKDNPKYSEFRNGKWRRGDFYNGYFGPERDFDYWDDIIFHDILYYPIRWESGNFYGGVFRNAVWHIGNFQGGIFYNSQWLNGIFSNGTFQGNKWFSGNFTGGDFVQGYWSGGTFNQSNPNIKSRFGSYPVSETDLPIRSDVSTYWLDGDFINGEFHSGLNIISGITQTSDNHNRTWWIKGNWYNGTWYGGTHIDGDFDNGYWLDGFWSGGTFNNGYWYNGFWCSGIINNGYFIHGVFMDVTYYSGLLGYQPSKVLINETLAKDPKIYVPPYNITTTTTTISP